MAGKSASLANPLPDLGCACATIRRTARLVTQLYSREMGSILEPTQFSMLSALSRRSGTSQAGLGRALGLDKTTMSRNLRLLHKKGWIEVVPSHDSRQRGYRLTASGNKMLAAATPGWMRAQASLRAGLKPGSWETMLKVLNGIAEAALKECQDSDGTAR